MAVNHLSAKTFSPRLPKIFSLPLSAVPDRFHSTVISHALNKVLHNQLRDGDLDSLEDRALCIHIRDAGIKYRLLLKNGKFGALHHHHYNDTIISGTLYDFALLATRREDPDTLFFQRRLRIEGDTELGLFIKNLLDSLDIDELTLPTPVSYALKRCLKL
jgi:predicted lipid carrier protein YhbT